MVNTFNEHGIPSYFFNFSLSISDDLLFYLYDNLYHENYNIFRWDLKNVLTTNANGEYI
jgi:hypothetical protein